MISGLFKSAQSDVTMSSLDFSHHGCFSTFLTCQSISSLRAFAFAVPVTCLRSDLYSPHLVLFNIYIWVPMTSLQRGPLSLAVLIRFYSHLSDFCIFLFFIKNIFIWKSVLPREKVGESEGEVFHPLVHFLNSCKARARPHGSLKPGDSSWSPMLAQGSGHLDHFLLLSSMQVGC